MARGPHTCDGGPLDGHVVTPAAGKYTWISGRLLAGWGELRPLPGQRPGYLGGGTGSSKPRDRCALYELTDAGLVYAGHRVYLCSCGAYHGKCEGGTERRPCALGGQPA
jgi:hypothetical protein